LIHETKYYVVAFAKNIKGVSFGNEVSFTTLAFTLPTVSTTSISNITASSASVGGNVTSIGGDVATVRGVCWSTSSSPTISDSHTNDGSGTGNYTSNISGLAPNTTYYVRAYATNSIGTAYGFSISFNTATIDFDGNVYTSVTIGTQIWMVGNLKTTHYRNGDSIPNITDNTQWSNLSTGAYCWYNNQISYKVPYGALYNWYAVNDSRNICPVGWHVPSDAEWTTLTTYLGGQTVAGGKMKEAGITHWTSPNTGATNESGFTALPSGGHYINGGTFLVLGYQCFYWSKTQSSVSFAWYLSLYYDGANCYRDTNGKQFGKSVRCIKD